MSKNIFLKKAWKAIVNLAPDQTAAAAIKRLRPHLIALGYGPEGLDDHAIKALLSRLVSLGRPNPEAETNSFIRAFNATPFGDGSRRAQLGFLPTVVTARAEAWAARPTLNQETSAFIAAFTGEMSEQRLKAGVMRLALAVEAAGLPCNSLRDLLTAQAIVAVIQKTSPQGIDQPSPARVHALYVLKAIATVLGDAIAVAFIEGKKKSKTLKMKGHTALLPTETIDRIARYDDPAERDMLLKMVMRTLLTKLQEKPIEANLYAAQAALAFLLAFFGGLSPSQIAACRFDHDQPDNSKLTTDFQHGKAEASVDMPDRIYERVGQYRLWLAAHGLPLDRPFINPKGECRSGKDIAHTLGSFLDQIGSNLRPLDVRDFGCSELFRMGKSFDYVRSHLRASSTQNVTNRLKPLRAHALHLQNQEATLARARTDYADRPSHA
jgi:hypothetical protein